MKILIQSAGSASLIAVLGAFVLVSSVRAQATWRPVPDLTVRWGHAMAYDPVRQRVVLFGGGYKGNQRRNMADTWEWDGKRWELLRPLVSPSPRNASVMAFDPVRKTMLLFGGYIKSRLSNKQTWLSETWEWDGRIWTQLKPATTPARRESAGMTTDWKRSKIVMFGGFTDVGVTGFFIRATADTWEWDGKDWTQRFPKTIPPARGTQSFAFNAKTQRIAMFGGHNNRAGWFTDTWEWDGKNWTQRFPKTSPPPAYSRMAADPLSGGTLLYSAGSQTSYKPGTWRWDGKNWTDLGQTLNPASRVGCMLASDLARRRVILFGGYDIAAIGTDHRETSSWDGKSWTKVHDWPFPEKLVTFGAYDGARDEFVLLQPQLWPSSTTWVMSDGVFRRLHPTISPPAHSSYAKGMLYHPGLQKVMYVYSWYTPKGLKNYIWFWDGKSWTQTSYKKGPDARNIHLAWDGHRQKVMAYAPETGALWEWDPKGWVRSTAANPPPRRSSTAFGYDPVRRRLVLFGGNIDSSPWTLGDTWEWDGKRWQKMSPKTSPLARYSPGMAYVPALGGMVLFAGMGVVGPQYKTLGDTWLWDGKDWTKLAVPLLPTIEGAGFPLYSSAYDPGRQRLVAFYGFSGGDRQGKSMWEFFFESLKTSQPYPRLGETFRLQIHLPRQAGKIFMLAMSRTVRPGIPLHSVPGLGVELLPLTPDPTFWASLNLGILTQLDAKGNGTIPMTVPNNAALLGLKVHAAGAAVDPKVGVTAITNDVALKVVK